jgi:hypothetical protein
MKITSRFGCRLTDNASRDGLLSWGMSCHRRPAVLLWSPPWRRIDYWSMRRNEKRLIYSLFWQPDGGWIDGSSSLVWLDLNEANALGKDPIPTHGGRAPSMKRVWITHKVSTQKKHTKLARLFLLIDHCCWMHILRNLRLLCVSIDNYHTGKRSSP